MLSKVFAAMLIAGSAAIELSAQPAAAMPVESAPMANSSALVQPVRWVYVPARHGPRFRYARPGYAYYYGGWWYPRPWWTTDIGPVVVAPEAPVVVGAPFYYGPRYLYWRPGFGYYHRGYWYRNRWW